MITNFQKIKYRNLIQSGIPVQNIRQLPIYSTLSQDEFESICHNPPKIKSGVSTRTDEAPVSFRLNPSLKEKLLTFVKLTNLNKSEIIKEALEEYFHNHKNAVSPAMRNLIDTDEEDDF